LPVKRSVFFLIFADGNQEQMLAYLQGKLTMKSPAMVHLETNGIGYELHISLNTYTAIQPLLEVRLHTYLQIKEDAHVLFGFFDAAEKEMFITLISVSGVGASTARMMLSSLRPAEIADAIASGNLRMLEAKVSVDMAGIPKTAANSLQEDALQALTALGIGRNQAEQALRKIITEPGHENLPLEEIIKKALKAI
jgi:Holliday junction DNA helicase RuvA